jgi:hypothetical protein
MTFLTTKAKWDFCTSKTNEIFEYLDKNGSGELELPEFMAFMNLKDLKVISNKSQTTMTITIKLQFKFNHIMSNLKSQIAITITITITKSNQSKFMC